MLLGYVVSMLVAKYKVNDWMRFWRIIYATMVILNIVVYFLDFMPPERAII